MEDTDVTFTIYKKKHYTDLIKSGYLLEPFPWMNNHLKPDFYNGLKNLLNWKEMKKLLRRTFLLDARAQREITLVAYAEKEKKAVGSITLRRITDSLWGMGSIFVSPSHRGRRIASSLYKETFRLLKEKDVEKTAGIISRGNVASVKSYKRSVNEHAFLDKRIFECRRIGPIGEDVLDQITVRKISPVKDESLFEIYEACVGIQWCSFLEINEENYLDRIDGPCFFEEYKSPLSGFVMKEDILVAECRRKVLGYATSRAIRFFNLDYVLHLFVPISKDFDNVCRALLAKALRPLNFRREDKFAFIYIGDEEAQDYLKNLGFEVKEILVVCHFL